MTTAKRSTNAFKGKQPALPVDDKPPSPPTVPASPATSAANTAIDPAASSTHSHGTTKTKHPQLIGNNVRKSVSDFSVPMNNQHGHIIMTREMLNAFIRSQRVVYDGLKLMMRGQRLMNEAWQSAKWTPVISDSDSEYISKNRSKRVTGYNLFAQERYTELKKSKSTPKEIFAALASEWQSLPSNKRNEYIDQAKQIRHPAKGKTKHPILFDDTVENMLNTIMKEEEAEEEVQVNSFCRSPDQSVNRSSGNVATFQTEIEPEMNRTMSLNDFSQGELHIHFPLTAPALISAETEKEGISQTWPTSGQPSILPPIPKKRKKKDGDTKRKRNRLA